MQLEAVTGQRLDVAAKGGGLELMASIIVEVGLVVSEIIILPACSHNIALGVCNP